MKTETDTLHGVRRMLHQQRELLASMCAHGYGPQAQRDFR